MSQAYDGPILGDLSCITEFLVRWPLYGYTKSTSLDDGGTSEGRHVIEELFGNLHRGRQTTTSSTFSDRVIDGDSNIGNDTRSEEISELKSPRGYYPRVRLLIYLVPIADETLVQESTILMANFKGYSHVSSRDNVSLDKRKPRILQSGQDGLPSPNESTTSPIRPRKKKQNNVAANRSRNTIDISQNYFVASTSVSARYDALPKPNRVTTDGNQHEYLPNPQKIMGYHRYDSSYGPLQNPNFKPLQYFISPKVYTAHDFRLCGGHCPHSLMTFSENNHHPTIKSDKPIKDDARKVEAGLLNEDIQSLKLLLKLVEDFPAERTWLVKPVPFLNHTDFPGGIHVFVDFSNISIGFLDCLRKSRSIVGPVQINPGSLSFEALVLIMERRRPIAKRVIAGSLPQVPAFNAAKAIGYEVNVLNRVIKPTLKNTRYNYNTDEMHGNVDLTTPVRSGASLIQVNSKQRSKQRWVEQGVDEILHLKILESVVDADGPSTIVLATGDAAVADYSAGFLMMILRALKKGWKVELVSWKRCIGSAYRKIMSSNHWKGQFKIIELDDYLLDLITSPAKGY